MSARHRRRRPQRGGAIATGRGAPSHLKVKHEERDPDPVARREGLRNVLEPVVIVKFLLALIVHELRQHKPADQVVDAEVGSAGAEHARRINPHQLLRGSPCGINSESDCEVVHCESPALLRRVVTTRGSPASSPAEAKPKPRWPSGV